MSYDYPQRMIDEYFQLQERRLKLREFLDSPAFRSLPGDEQDRLQRQNGAMAEYASILDERIQASHAG